MNSLSLNDPDLLRQQAYIGGRWCDADNGKSFPVTDPATGELLAQVPDMQAAETRRAIEAAKAAWPDWRRKTAKDRAVLLRKWYDLMMANVDDLARIMTAEQGKPLAESIGEISYAASFIEWFAEEGKRVINAILDIHAVSADACLTGVPVFRNNCSFHGRVEIGVVKDDERRVATELQRDLFDRIGALPHQKASDFRRTGEGDLPDIGIGGHFPSDQSRFSGQDIQHSSGDPGSFGKDGESERG